jgi:hypothetical protein
MVLHTGPEEWLLGGDVHPDDREKMVISTGQELWKLTIMPLGLFMLQQCLSS